MSINYGGAAMYHGALGFSLSSSQPWTMVGRVNFDAFSGVAQWIISIGDDNGGERITLGIRGTTDDVKLGSNGHTTGAGTVLSTDIDYHLGVTHSSSDVIEVFLNGVLDYTSGNDGNIVWANIDTISIGAARYNSTINSGTNGYAAEQAIYDVELSAEEFASFGKGASALQIRPASLIHYFPAIASDGSDPQEVIGKISLTKTGSPGSLVRPHFPIFMPEEMKLFPVVAAIPFSFPLLEQQRSYQHSGRFL